MELLLSWVNAAACGLISVALIGAILSPNVRDGVVIKVGLICLASGFGAIALRLIDSNSDVLGMERALFLVNAGVAVVIFGYLARKDRRSQKRRSSDWMELDTKPAEDRR